MRTRRRLLLAGLVLLGLAASAGALSAAAPGGPARDVEVVLDSGRAYRLHVPPQLVADPGAAAGRPALVVLHGLDDDPAGAARTTGFNSYADRDGRLVAYGEGVRDSFNAGLCCGEAVTLGIDDVTYLADVVRSLRMAGASRVGVVGFSNGGMMAYRFACAHPELVDTVGVMSGTLEIPRCAGPIRALAIHGELDRTVPLAGTGYSPLLQAFLRDVRTIPAAAPGSRITLRVLPGYRHRWTEPGDPVDATAEFWRFAGMN